MTTRVLTGEALGAAIDDIARLRIVVFRDWPYLYDGDLAYEREYLKDYTHPTAVVVAAFDGSRIVGAATGMALEIHADDFAAPFGHRPEPLDQIFYCAESVLLPDYRGRGFGHAFFDAREAHARALGRRYSAFCSVVRPDDHPLKPPGARSHDAFWRGRGYAPLPGVVATFRWRDIDQPGETDHDLQFWMRAL
ncbi:GNAT family acetyltransferase [Primorskyibacter flagellatus]|uniref:GNAT family acetyltransferase n=1 Tax=Primorskyibacter flagellatus TaxID=1387277 RepID=A0A917A806_9RHOB|nr:GNAT family N-acetyltransferase [Primorskyibacter flagellatus]GGE32853.1 GNAT family acetyltransferase [Primorskyibacter flagellatus]